MPMNILGNWSIHFCGDMFAP